MPSTKPSNLLRIFATGGSLLAGLLLVGCVTPDFAEHHPTERRLGEAYRALMSAEEQRTYLSKPTLSARLEYAGSLGLPERFERLSEADQALVLSREIDEGMATDAVLLSWGAPDSRSVLNDGHEQWFYDAANTTHLDTGQMYWLFLRDGVLVSWHSELVDAPGEVPDNR